MAYININKINIILLRDYKEEFFDISPACYLNFDPIEEPGKCKYIVIKPHLQDSLCYIKHKKKDNWIYEENEKLLFKPLQEDKNGFVIYKPPVVFWIWYLEHPTFILYKYIAYGNPNLLYLVYSENNGNIQLLWTTNQYKASIFIYEEIEWNKLLNHNLHAKYDLVDKKNYSFSLTLKQKIIPKNKLKNQ